jgi:hypothetical protein
MVGLALTMSTSAGAVVSITLTQVGGTYDGASANAGDTLVLDIGYSWDQGVDAVTLVDPALVFNGAVSSFDAAGSTETAVALWNGGGISFAPLSTGDIGLAAAGQADGWEKATILAGGATSACIFGACSSLGTASFVLSGTSGVISVGAVGLPFGTRIGDGAFQDITAVSNLGTFTIVPEPTTASLLGLGLLGLTIAGRRRN